MNAQGHSEKLDFQAEVRQLLDLMVHSLYSNKEIFLRELISNASDACDKLRFEALTDPGLLEGGSDLRIEVDFDKDNSTITVRDNGIGMSRQEVMDNIGTIARSGTREFLQSMTGDQAADAKLIGQFGVGFYSTFIVADRVRLLTRRAGLESEHGVLWESDGKGSYTLETVPRAERGTEVTLYLRKDEDELLAAPTLQSIIRKYSDHVAIPVLMRESASGDEGEAEWQTVNSASALWARPRSELSDDEYKEFYKHISHDLSEPLAWVHNHVEGRQSYVSLFYIPSRAPFDIWDRQNRHGIKLYVRRVFIMDDAEQILPPYLRFIRGVVDSDDLPLNISREILQHNRLIETIRSASVKKILGLLDSLARKEAEKYAIFWAQFGNILKEGIAEDFANRERIATLLRFASTRGDDDECRVSLQDYVDRMKFGQESIYYITADCVRSARNSPHLEVFREKNIEVLLLGDRVDEWMIAHLPEFKGKPVVSVAKGDLDLGKLEDAETKNRVKEAAEEHKDLIERIKVALGERVKDVRVSRRLKTSPACVVLEAHDIAVHLQRVLKQAGHEVPDSKPILEINPEHVLIRRLGAESDPKLFEHWAALLLDQGLLNEGGQLEEPTKFVNRLNRILTELVEHP